MVKSSYDPVVRKAYNDAKRTAGECLDCQEPATVKARCQKHHDYYCTIRKARYDRLRAEGKCVDCGEPSPRFAACLTCRKARLKNMAARREAYKRERMNAQVGR